MADLRAVVVMDYQNIHLTGHDLFTSSRHRAKHESLVDPLLYVGELMRVRNRSQRSGHDHAVLARVQVYRGLPSADHDPESYARQLGAEGPLGA